MKRLIWVIMTAVLWIGCKPGIPADIIRPDKMEKVLYDIHIADGYISTIPTVDSAKKVGAAYYDGIYKKFEIDSASYTKSMDYYYAHPEALSLIYKSIDSRIKMQTKAIQRIDSLNDAKLISAQVLNSERITDSIFINKGYDMDMAEKGLYLERYKNIYSENAIIFNLLKIKKDGKMPQNSVDKLKLKTDTLVTEKKLKVEKPILPIEAMPVKIK